MGRSGPAGCIEDSRTGNTQKALPTVDLRKPYGYFTSMTRRFSALEAVETGVAMAMAGPLVSAAAPVINGIVEGGSLSGMLPEGVIEKGRQAISGLTQSMGEGRGLGARVSELVSSLRGGLVGQNIPTLGAFSDKVGEIGFGANLFPDGLRLPSGHALEGSVNRLKQDVGRYF